MTISEAGGGGGGGRGAMKGGKGSAAAASAAGGGTRRIYQRRVLLPVVLTLGLLLPFLFVRTAFVVLESASFCSSSLGKFLSSPWSFRNFTVQRSGQFGKYE